MLITNEDPEDIKMGEEELDENGNPIKPEPEPKVDPDVDPETGEELIKVPKSKFTAIQRKAIAYDAGKKSGKPLPAEQATPVSDEVIKDVATLKSAEEKRQYGYQHELSPEETDKVFQLAGGKPTVETLKDPFIIAGLEAMRASKRVDKNIPGASRGAKLYGGKPFAELDKAGKQKAWEEQMQGK